MDEDFMLWNFLEEERERYNNSKDDDGKTEAQQEYDEDEDELTDDELIELLSEKLGNGLLRQGGNY